MTGSSCLAGSFCAHPGPLLEGNRNGLLAGGDGFATAVAELTLFVFLHDLANLALIPGSVLLCCSKYLQMVPAVLGFQTELLKTIFRKGLSCLVKQFVFFQVDLPPDL